MMKTARNLRFATSLTTPGDSHAALFADILAVRVVLRGVADAPPMVPAPHLTRLAGENVLLKLKIAQPVGAFKLRKALNAVSALPGHVAGVVCCSVGNHGRAVAYAASQKGLRAVVCMSALVPEAKVAGIRALGTEIHISGQSQDNAMAESRRMAAAEGLVPPLRRYTGDRRSGDDRP